MLSPEAKCLELWLGGRCVAFNDPNGAAAAIMTAITTDVTETSFVAQSSIDFLELLAVLMDELAAFLKVSYFQRINALSKVSASSETVNQLHCTIRTIRSVITSALASVDVDATFCFIYSETDPKTFSILHNLVPFVKGTPFEETTVTFPSLETVY